MKRVFVLGAGFSWAVAKLPLIRGMIPRILSVIEEDLKSTDHERRVWAGWVYEFINRAEERYLRGPLSEKGFQVLSSDFLDDFEFLLTILDLNSTGTHEAVVRDPNGNQSATTVGRIELAQDHPAGLAIEDFIHRVLWREQISWDLLARFISTSKPGDTIITFNYDMLLDRAMYVEGLWHPSNGYGIDRFAPTPQWLEVPRDSPVTILKLHGSLNWDVSGDPMLLHWFYDSNTPYFPNCVVTPAECDMRRFPRQGFGILPSFSKRFVSRSILEIWRKAHSALRHAEEVIVIGYSLPAADSAAWTLFGTSMSSAQTVVVYAKDDAKDVARRFSVATGCDAMPHAGGLEEFLEG